MTQDVHQAFVTKLHHGNDAVGSKLVLKNEFTALDKTAPAEIHIKAVLSYGSS
jgi:hypothetical protein